MFVYVYIPFHRRVRHATATKCTHTVLCVAADWYWEIYFCSSPQMALISQSLTLFDVCLISFFTITGTWIVSNELGERKRKGKQSSKYNTWPTSYHLWLPPQTSAKRSESPKVFRRISEYLVIHRSWHCINIDCEVLQGRPGRFCKITQQNPEKWPCVTAW